MVDIPLGYTADLDHARALLRQVATKLISQEPISKHLLGPADVLGVQGLSAEGNTLRRWAVVDVCIVRVVLESP